MEASPEQRRRSDASFHGEVVIVILTDFTVREVTRATVVNQRRTYLRRRSGGNQARIRIESCHGVVRAIRHDDRNARGEIVRRRIEVTTKALDASVGVA